MSNSDFERLPDGLDLGGLPELTGDTIARFLYTIEQASEGIFWLDQGGRFTYVNRQACQSLGYTREELLDLHLWDIDPDFSAERWAGHWEELRTARRRTLETRHRHKDGHIFPVEVSVCQVEFGESDFHAAFVRDITERRQAREEQARLERQLQQAQKLEAIGTLAGGIAHDFNNMLSVILGYAELLRGKVAGDEEALKDVVAIDEAASRSREITRQLLAFSRQQVISPVPVDINRHLEATAKMFGRLIGEDVQVSLETAPDLWPVEFDPSQLDQVLINLAVNARDAMPGGGTLTIRTENVMLDRTRFSHGDHDASGPYVRLSLQDSGTGMDAATLARIFEPFFTTKDVGRGTGLGLAMIYGIMMQNDGFIDVTTEPGQGSRFDLYFRRLERAEEPTSVPTAAPSPGTGVILLVEDNDLVRDMTARMIENLGYTVIAVADPRRALEICAVGETAVDLLLTDVVMPGLSGKQLADRVRESLPDVRVLFMSGYSHELDRPGGALPRGTHFIQKPFTLQDLAGELDRLLKA